MSNALGFRTSVLALGLFSVAGCMTFSSADEAKVVDRGGASSGESATLAAETNVVAAGSGAGGDGTVKAAGDVGTAASATAADGSAPGATAASDPAAAATVATYLDKIGSEGPTGTLRTQVIDAVIRACDVFAPPAGKDAGWQRTYCWAHLASEILKESTYNPTSSVTDSYATRAIGSQTANDPTVGLLQIRFSSVVHDFVAQGPTDRLAFVGCTFPASVTSHASEAGDSSFWAVTGPSANRSLVESVSCNVGIGAWYVYMNATGNGKSTGTTYLSNYCAGQGTKANLVTGLSSFLEGPTAAYGALGSMSQVQSSDGGSYAYINAIKTSFDAMIGPVGGTHPFFLPLVPTTSSYCR